LQKIKERNKVLLPKKDVPKAPFFLFDIEKLINGEDKAEEGKQLL